MALEKISDWKKRWYLGKNNTKPDFCKKKHIKIWDSYSLLDDSLDKLSKTLLGFPSLDTTGMKDEMFARKLTYAYEDG